MTIREERPDDATAIHEVVWAAFGQRMEADLVDRLRSSNDLLLSLVAENEDRRIAGHIAFSPLKLEGVRAVGLAPVSVRPDLQNKGIGSALIRAAIELLRERGEQAIFVLGHADYYPRFGFRRDLAAQFDSPYAGDHFFAMELEEGSLLGRSGTVSFASAFASFN